ncbi:hypothetical protein HYV71_04175, partial [Candidatus Uhrbacteria bacterium]|nr:hypothetical protein [Candidatus Uhrbacteria bacterium]
MALAAQQPQPMPARRPRRSTQRRSTPPGQAGVIVHFRQPSAPPPPPPPPPEPTETEDEEGDDNGRSERLENLHRLATAKHASHMQAYNLAMQFRAAESEHRNEVFFMVLIAAMVIDGIDLV